MWGLLLASGNTCCLAVGFTAHLGLNCCYPRGPQKRGHFHL